MNNTKSLLATLFDFSFTHFVTAKLVKLLFALGILGALIGAFQFIAGGFDKNAGWGVLAILVSPVVFLVFCLLVRVALEIIIVLFRIAESVQVLADFELKDHAPNAGGTGGAPGASQDGASTVISLDQND